MVPKKCKSCGAPEESWPIKPRNRMAKACSIDCARVLARKDAETKAKQNRRAWKHENKTYPQLLKEAQRAFNRYIRERDRHLPCICCDKPATQSPNEWDAGHYRSVGAANHLRFDERNCHKQSKRCNQYLGGNYAMYRTGLINRYGVDFVLEIESDNKTKKYTRDDLRKIKDEYNKKYAEARKKNADRDV